MPLLSFRFEKDSAVFKKLKAYFDISEIPSLFLVDNDGAKVGYNLKNILKMDNLDDFVRTILKTTK